MGTNYYWREPGREFASEDRDGCGLHIGKISAGSLGLRGYLGSEAEARILSWDDWRGFLRDREARGDVWSEYGYTVPVEEFIADIDATSAVARRAQITWLRSDPHSLYRGRFRERIEPDGDWSDREGYSLHAGYFC